MLDEIKEVLAAREALPRPEAILHGARFDMDRAKWEKLWHAIETLANRWRTLNAVETNPSGLQVIRGVDASDFLKSPAASAAPFTGERMAMDPAAADRMFAAMDTRSLDEPGDEEGEPGGPVEEIDFLLAHSTALRSVLMAQQVILDLTHKRPGDAFDAADAHRIGVDHTRRGLDVLDRLVSEFVAERESPVPLHEWTEALAPADRGMMGNALAGLMHYAAQLGDESGVAVILRAVLYAVAAERVSIGGTVPPADEAFASFLDELQTIAATPGLAQEADSLGRAVMRTLAAIIAHKRGDRLSGWFQALAQAAAGKKA